MPCERLAPEKEYFTCRSFLGLKKDYEVLVPHPPLGGGYALRLFADSGSYVMQFWPGGVAMLKKKQVYFITLQM